MDTAYKTRAYWMLKALEYAFAAIAGVTHTGRNACSDQIRCWNDQAVKCGVAAVAPSGCVDLTRMTVDRKGNLLPEWQG